METINDINEILISAHSTRHSFIYNVLAVFTLHLSTFFLASHYDKVCPRGSCVAKRTEPEVCAGDATAKTQN